ncbi:MAG: response regulator [Verrucomicrobia bacterium]|nr:response regulator [Verrucomicrobiota bacterium]
MSFLAALNLDFALSIGSVKSAMLISILSVWVLIGLFTYLNRYTKRRYFTLWTVAWLFYALWLSLNYVLLESKETPWMLMYQQWCVGVSATFLLWGSSQFLGLRVRERTLGLFLGFLLVWSYVGAYYLVNPLHIQMPIFGLIGVTSGLTAFCFFKYRRRKQFIGATLLGFGFLLWGTYFASYPFFQMTDALTASGFFISAVLQLFIAVSMIILVLEEVRQANQTAIQHIRSQKSKNSALRMKVHSTEERYRSLFDQASEAIIICDATDLRILELNTTAQRMLGLNQAASLLRHLPSVCHAAHAACMAPTAAKEWFNWSCQQPQLNLVRKNGGTTLTELDGALIDFEGKPAYQFFFREVTERTKLEQQLRQAEKLSALGQMISGVSHELNNPLAVIRGYLEMVLTHHELAPNTRSDLEKISLESARAAKLVKNFLAFSRDQPSEREMVDLNEMIERTVDLRKLDFQQRNVQVTLCLQLDLPRTEADPDQIQQIAGNLMTNAIQAMERSKGPHRLQISSKSDGKTIQITVEDNGPGVPAEIEQKIFEPFFTTKQVGLGTGLGLSIAHSIMAEHKGKILYQSSSLGGAAFILELPVVEKLSAIPARVQPSAPAKPKARTRSGRILVLDDELALAELLCDMLRMLGHQPTFCLNPLAALELMNQRHFDLVLSDFRMPGMSGKEFHDAVFQRDRDLARRIVFLTGDVIADETFDFIRENGNAHLEKPFQLTDLAQIISEKLQETESASVVKAQV